MVDEILRSKTNCEFGGEDALSFVRIRAFNTSHAYLDATNLLCRKNIRGESPPLIRQKVLPAGSFTNPIRPFPYETLCKCLKRGERFFIQGFTTCNPESIWFFSRWAFQSGIPSILQDARVHVEGSSCKELRIVRTWFTSWTKLFSFLCKPNLPNNQIIKSNFDLQHHYTTNFLTINLFTFSSEKVLDLCKMWTPPPTPRFCQMFMFWDPLNSKKRFSRMCLSVCLYVCLSCLSVDV